MKLSEYLYKKVTEDHEEYVKPPDSWPITEKDVETWIIEWYNGEFNEVGCDGGIPKPRMPPMWLANWRINEAT